MNREFELRYTGRTEDGREFVRVSHPDFPERYPDEGIGGYVFCNNDGEILYRGQRYPRPKGSLWDAYYGYAWPVFLALSLGSFLSLLMAALGIDGWGQVLPGAVLGALPIGIARAHRNRKGHAAARDAVLTARKAKDSSGKSGSLTQMMLAAEADLPYIDMEDGKIWTPAELRAYLADIGAGANVRKRQESDRIRARLEHLQLGEKALRAEFLPQDEFRYPALWARNRRRLGAIAEERARLTAALERLADGAAGDGPRGRGGLRDISEMTDHELEDLGVPPHGSAERTAPQALYDLWGMQERERDAHRKHIQRWLDAHTRPAFADDRRAAISRSTYYGSVREDRARELLATQPASSLVVMTRRPAWYPDSMCGALSRIIIIPSELGVSTADLPGDFHGYWGHNEVFLVKRLRPW